MTMASVRDGLSTLNRCLDIVEAAVDLLPDLLDLRSAPGQTVDDRPDASANAAEDFRREQRRKLVAAATRRWRAKRAAEPTSTPLSSTERSRRRRARLRTEAQRAAE